MKNRQAWKKLGLIFCATGQNSTMVAGGRAPVPLHISEDRFRIYFGCYDDIGRGRIFSADIDIKVPQNILHLRSDPIVDIGAVGYYDDNGIIPSDIIRVGNEIYLYTIGFSLKNRVLFDASSGLAISSDNGNTFKKYPGPILDRGVDDPCFAASPSVLRDEKEWRMWYVSCDHWVPHGEHFRHYYNIKHRTSKDGIYWDQHAKLCIDYKNEFEYAISRPSVLRSSSGLYQMWYSYRAQMAIDTYRIGYAESIDGLKWDRMDWLVDLDVSQVGWDSEMVCYPYVFKHRDNLFMLYNGNSYGKSGFGLAVLEDRK
jgi:hypothetical protein